MRRVALILIVSVSLLWGEESSWHLSLRSLVHAEHEQMLAKDTNRSFPDEGNSFSSWYNHLRFDYDVSDAWFVSLGGKTNAVLGEQNYKTPRYLGSKSTSEDIDRAMLSEASLNYDDGLFALNVGRSEVDFDWIRGSMDGVIGMVGDDKSASLRLFWMENYTDLSYNYSIELRDINTNKGFYGAVAMFNGRYGELALYDYWMPELRNIMGTHAYLAMEKAGVNLSFTYADSLPAALYPYDEYLASASLELLFGRHFFEFGGSQTGENGLAAMVQLGSFMFGQFYLSNQVDRDSALNGFGRYIYADGKWRFELLGGVTRYDNVYVQKEDSLFSQEVDLYLGYRFSRRWAVESGLMAMNVEERDPIQTSQLLFTTNIVFSYDVD